jgi:hypothetical protein
MKFTNEDMAYISGEKMSIWYTLSLTNNPLSSRLDCLMNLTKNKRVLHIGCCDHIPYIMEKIKSKTWLHGLLLENCSFVAGIDINDEAIQYVIDRVLLSNYTSPPPPNNKHNLYQGNVTIGLPKELCGISFDYALLGEVVEHVDDPVSFLKKIRENLNDTVEKVIITVPYAFGLRQMFSGCFKRERINTDHRYWFTPYTIAKICFQAGIYPEELLFCGNPPLPLRIMMKVKKVLHGKELSCFSTLGNTLLLIGSFKKQGD